MNYIGKLTLTFIDSLTLRMVLLGHLFLSVAFPFSASLLHLLSSLTHFASQVLIVVQAEFHEVI
jgi:hypothetical protein